MAGSEVGRMHGRRIAVRINQINFTYVPLEDRLVFRFNTLDKMEFRMWLTRAKSLQMLGLLNQAAKINFHSQKMDFAQPAMQAMMDFRRDAVLAVADYQTTFSSEVVSFPLGEQPVLLAELALDASAETPMLTFQLLTGTSVSLIIDQELGMAVGKLLSDVLCKTDWGIEAAEGLPIKGARAAVMVH